MTAIDWWSIGGTVIGLVSLVLAGVQTVRYQVARRLLERINEREQVATWALYDLIIQAYDDIVEARDALRAADGAAPVKAIEKTAQTASLLNAMWLATVEHASTLEPKFDSAAVDRWTDLGRLDTAWRIARARKLLPIASEVTVP